MAKRRKRPSLSLPLPFPLPRFIQACTLSRTFSTARHGDNIAGTNTANRLPRGFPSLRIFVSPRPTGFYATGGEGNFKPEEGGRRKKVTFLPPPLPRYRSIEFATLSYVGGGLGYIIALKISFRECAYRTLSAKRNNARDKKQFLGR